MAIASLTLAIIGLFIGGLPLGILAFILGIVACANTDAYCKTSTEVIIAIIGLVLGAVDALVVCCALTLIV